VNHLAAGAVDATEHYLSDEVDPRFLAAARDALLPLVRGPRVLNVGVGYGVWCAGLAPLAEAAHAEVIGVDLDDRLVAHARRRFPAIDYRVGRAEDLVDPDGFDTIIASHLLEHVDEPVGLLRLWRSLLRPDGRILVVVPNAGSAHRHLGVEMGLLGAVTDLNDGDRLLGHRRVYTRAGLEAHIAAAGLHVERLFGVTFKPVSNAQLAAMPRAYVDACLALQGEQVGDLGMQLAAVLTA
jgi:2-polyprenyl-3-methyl-5-hydroxy-6-metoxy-1,4-benzoquinol methylase